MMFTERAISRFMAHVFMLSCYITVLITFAYAYLNGRRVTITLDSYGEAAIEAIVLLLSIPIVASYLVRLIHSE